MTQEPRRVPALRGMRCRSFRLGVAHGERRLHAGSLLRKPACQIPSMMSAEILARVDGSRVHGAAAPTAVMTALSQAA